MIVDAHCHVWEHWPYQPPVPDPGRAGAEHLLYEMDANGVERAVLICAAIGDNSHNADYAFAAAARHQDRFTVFPDLECRWAPNYQSPGAARRLAAALDRWEFVGFTLYLDEAEDGSWLNGEDGSAFFALAATSRLILSLSMLPHQMPAVAQLAASQPTLPILCHHHAFLGPRTETTPNSLGLVTDAAVHQNIFVKLSGMGNVAAADDEYPYDKLRWIPEALRQAYGPDRLVWGSDYPVSRRHMTYKQTVAMTARHGPFTPAERTAVLGGTMARLLAQRQV